MTWWMQQHMKGCVAEFGREYTIVNFDANGNIGQHYSEVEKRNINAEIITGNWVYGNHANKD